MNASDAAVRQGNETSTASGDAFDRKCPGRIVLDHMTSRWGVLILVALRGGPLRFYELRNRVGGISEKMLSQSLRTFVRDGLIARTVESTVPPKVSYALTPLGESVTEPLQQLMDWILVRTNDVMKSWDRHDRNL